MVRLTKLSFFVVCALLIRGANAFSQVDPALSYQRLEVYSANKTSFDFNQVIYFSDLLTKLQFTPSSGQSLTGPAKLFADNNQSQEYLLYFDQVKFNDRYNDKSAQDISAVNTFSPLHFEVSQKITLAPMDVDTTGKQGVPISRFENGFALSFAQVSVKPGAYIETDLDAKSASSFLFRSSNGRFYVNGLNGKKYTTIAVQKSNLVLDLYQLDTLWVKVDSSALAIFGSSLSGSTVTITNSMVKGIALDAPTNLSLNLSNSTLSGDFAIQPGPKNVIVFSKDTLENCNMYSIGTNYLSILDCFAKTNVKITGFSEKDTIELTGTDVSQINFGSSLGFIVGHKSIDHSPNAENLIEETFEQLLNVLTVQKNNALYRAIDIQYQQYKFSQYPLVGLLWSWIDRAWWNYGYAKDRILLWTAGFLLGFFLINLVIERKLFNCYPIFTDRLQVPYKTNLYYYLNKMVRVFIFTNYVFFSLRINFSQLKSTKSAILLYFFSQYFIGLICSFFLLNALFKL